jgi:hypothetical protein
MNCITNREWMRRQKEKYNRRLTQMYADRFSSGADRAGLVRGRGQAAFQGWRALITDSLITDY